VSTPERRRTLSADTSAEAEAIQIERWRGMSVREKAMLVTQLSQAADAMALAGIRAAYPHASARERFLRLAIRRLGRELAERVYPEIANLQSPR
jgi:hypothetical protein